MFAISKIYCKRMQSKLKPDLNYNLAKFEIKTRLTCSKKYFVCETVFVCLTETVDKNILEHSLANRH